jgi:DNA-binding transcriptional LysR family regulator
MNEPVETSELLAFSKTVDAKSLSRAAAELGVPRATVSRRLARLEERLGARLLRRTTRSLVLTDAGEALYRHARIVLDAVSHAEASVRRTDDAVRGDLRVSVPPLLSPSFYAMLCEFARQHPEVRLHVHFSSRHVDLRRDGYDVAIRASTALEPGLVARTLARAPLVAAASPAYLAAAGVPRTRRDLRDHRCLMGFARGELPETQWPLPGGGKLHVDGMFFSNEPTLLCDAALRGLGIAVLPLLIARPFLESGALVQVLPGVIQAESRVAVVYPEREFVPPQVRAFVDAVAAWAPGELDRDLPVRCREAAAQRSGAAAHSAAPVTPPKRRRAAKK